ncbi:UbiA family prenyltransferase [Halobacteria archaeon AArc-m2/3/4]|uniref:UbiA family prenyltransferase n=1 Tax=Natronoglomus mannanivorans TaxID=2979990 RepID=A0AAP2Z1Q6_9EURY|nr:UbiA family prenyltransferase [Halobacteria archaeon AArc-xg1-1]MCU4973448.1 UbiA family prenyltransferase [Halobacteria archaeon AArc-m2/3/4]
MRRRRPGQDLFGLFVSCSLYLVVNSVLILVISALFVGGKPFDAGVGILTLCSLTAFVYITDRLLVTDEDRINNPDRTALVEEYDTELLAVAVLLFVLFELSILTTAVTPDAFGLLTLALGHVPLAVLAVYDKIKTATIPLDSLAVAFAWAYQIVYIFVFIAATPLDVFDSVVLFGCWFLIVFAGLEMRNVGDIEGDREAGKVTFACVLGARVTKRLGIALKTIGALVLTSVSGSLLVFGLLLVHLLSLRFYRTLEAIFRYQSPRADAVEASPSD